MIDSVTQTELYIWTSLVEYVLVDYTDVFYRRRKKVLLDCTDVLFGYD